MRNIFFILILAFLVNILSCKNFLWPEKENDDENGCIVTVNTTEEDVIVDKNALETNFTMININFEHFSEDSIILGEDIYDINSFKTTVKPFKIGKFELTYNTWYFIYKWATSSDRGENIYSFGKSGVEGQYGNAESQNPISTGEPKLVDMPVADISWYDAIVWCNALNEYLGLNCVYFSDSDYKNPIRTSPKKNYPMSNSELELEKGEIDNPYVNEKSNGYRLPTNKEWEYAARKNKDGSFISGLNCSGDSTGSFYEPDNIEKLNGIDYKVSAIKNDYVWWYRTSAGDCEKTERDKEDTISAIKQKTGNSSVSGRRHHLVGGKKPNNLNIYDMCGNVMEWCFDMAIPYGYSYKVSNSRYARNGEVFNDFSNHPLRTGFPQSIYPSAGCGLRLAQSK